MLGVTNRMLGIQRPETRLGGTCDLCGATESYFCAKETPQRLRTFVCSKCGLIYAAPQPSPVELDELNLQNSGDRGSLVWSPFGVLDERYAREQEADVSWASKIIERFICVNGKQVLSLRCLSGGLPAELRGKGAEVFGVDSFHANIRYAREVRGLSNTVVVSMSRLHELNLPWNCQFDAIEGLTIHILAHVMYPRLLLSRIFDLLKPGGYLFLDEKDVLLPAQSGNHFVLDSGQAHQFQLTQYTTASYLRGVGFDLIECEIDSERASGFRHIRVVARKPDFPNAETLMLPLWARPRGKDILWHLKKLEWSVWLKTRGRFIKIRGRQFRKSIPGILKHIPGLEQTWRRARQTLRH